MSSSAAEPSLSLLRGFVLLRIIIVTTLLLSAFLIQVSFDITLPLKPIYYLAAFAYSGAIAAIVTLGRIRPEAHAALQLLTDLGVITGLIYVSQGPDSGFTFLYLGTIAAGALLLGRRGALITAGLATVFYSVLVDLMYTKVLPPVLGADAPPRVWMPAALVGNVAMNVAAFLATGLLVSASSQRLRETRADLAAREADMSRLQALHTSLLASITSGVMTTDPRGLVTYVNPPGLELLGKTGPDVIGRPAESSGLLDRELWARIRGSVETLRFEGRRPEIGKDAYFGIAASVLRDDRGRAAGRVLVFQNVTELKKLEAEVRLKEKMAAVGELAAGIAHEIRNPLASISGSVQVLRSSSPPGSSERRLMEIVVTESQRLSRVLEDFLGYVRPREQNVEPVDAPGALRDVVTLLQHSQELSDRHQVELHLEPDSVVLPADHGQLRQIFWNVARNAIAAMPEGGILSVSARVEGGRWIAAIRDSGHGMSVEERDRLFTPFAHNFPGGTGLGMAIVYRIVEEHGGVIHVQTEKDRGTVIEISLPLSLQPPERAVA